MIFIEVCVSSHCKIMIWWPFNSYYLSFPRRKRNSKQMTWPHLWAQKAILDEEKEYLENPWTIHSKGPLVQLFPQLSSATIIRNDSAPENTPDGYLMKGITTSGDEIVLTLWFGKDNRTSTASMMSSSIHISLESRGSKVDLHSAQCIDASRNGIRKIFLVWQFESLRF